MILEIHKNGAHTHDAHIDIEEVFPPYYHGPQRQEVADTEAQALYDCLKEILPPETKASLLTIIKHNGL
jgi:hypothetical protein